MASQNLDLNPKPKRPQYCFRAVARLVERSSQRTVATFTAFDRSPLVGSRVFAECEQAARIDDDYEAMPVELVLFESCPVESTGDITIF